MLLHYLAIKRGHEIHGGRPFVLNQPLNIDTREAIFLPPAMSVCMKSCFRVHSRQRRKKSCLFLTSRNSPASSGTFQKDKYFIYNPLLGFGTAIRFFKITRQWNFKRFIRSGPGARVLHSRHRPCNPAILPQLFAGLNFCFLLVLSMRFCFCIVSLLLHLNLKMELCVPPEKTCSQD